MDWFSWENLKTGNHRYFPMISMGLKPVNFPLNQSIETNGGDGGWVLHGMIRVWNGYGSGYGTKWT